LNLIDELSASSIKGNSGVVPTAIVGTFNALFTKSGVGSASVNIRLQDWTFLL